MVDAKIIHKQLKKLKFGASPWNQAELRELPHILHEHEEIAELVNGFYEGGVALLVATDMRLLLIDKKPLNYLNVEDLRFDMINEIDYSHRLVGATIIISTGSKTLKFKSYNQARLRGLINLVQERMSLIKKEQSDKADNQQQHLEEINKQLQMYLMAQHQQLQQQISEGGSAKPAEVDLPKPNAQLADYLFAQRLLEKFQKENGALPIIDQTPQASTPVAPAVEQPPAPAAVPQSTPVVTQADLVADAKQEVFGKPHAAATQPQPAPTPPTRLTSAQARIVAAPITPIIIGGVEVNPIRIAYSKLPMLLRNRRFGRSSMHEQAQQQPMPTGQAAPMG